MSIAWGPDEDWPEFTPQQAARLRRELAALKTGLENAKPSERLQWLHVAPSRVGKGDLVLADGTDWDPVGWPGLALRNEANDEWLPVSLGHEDDAWTPTIQGLTTPGTGWTYGLQEARYTKIGRRVFIGGRVNLTAVSGTAAGIVVITGLPYTSSASTHAGIAISNVNNLTTAVVSVDGRVLPGTTQIVLMIRTAAAASGAAMVVGDLSNTTTITFGGHYITD